MERAELYAQLSGAVFAHTCEPVEQEQATSEQVLAVVADQLLYNVQPAGATVGAVNLQKVAPEAVSV